MITSSSGSSGSKGKEVSRFKDRGRVSQALIITAGFLAVIWVIQIINALSGYRLTTLGIHPQDLSRIWGILPAPLIHVDFGHIIANTPAVAVLLFLVALSGHKAVWASSTMTMLVAGAGVFAFGGENTVHVGASSLIYGWAVFLAIRGFFTRRILEILLGVVVVIVYAGLFWGIFPNEPGVSWQGHLFGAIGGGLAAWGSGRVVQKEKTQGKS
ncbi:MAG TPA: rhomboid family intramembrane serine protease [Candidatus Corynebacterium avicola]|uniref:Rhomboid family intramembrane serine protease n=1 Tax=Candidatus Corynebacterium avicola TaxID=2838527 RepID=A0A9D1ULT2_9CORY|nr:rhomboid family intramembrane serine protease [Candidatus Corynebacterium avicola]